MSVKFPRRGWGKGEQNLTQLAVKILCDNSTGCNEVDDYFATKAYIMVDIVYQDDLNAF